MPKITRFVGLDVHAAKIVASVAGTEGEPGTTETFPNTKESVRKFFRRLGDPKSIRACYEAGPCGFVLHRQLTEMQIECIVVAPTLIPTKPGDRVKTDNRDAMKLARLLRSGDLTAAWVPDPAHEALRDLVRERAAARDDLVAAKNRLGKFVLRHGIVVPVEHRGAVGRLEWLKGQKMKDANLDLVLLDLTGEVDHQRDRVARLETAIERAIAEGPERTRAIVEALQALCGVGLVTAATLVAEIGSFLRFENPKQLMGYVGVVPSEYSSGSQVRRGAITKTGNSRVRHVLIEAAWHFRRRPSLTRALRKRQEGLTPEIKAISWKAQHRLHDRYVHLLAAKKTPQVAVTAVARELLGFVWDIGRTAEQQLERRSVQ